MNPVQGTNPSKLEAPEQNPSKGIRVLPQDLLESIFKRLTPKNQSRMARTCTTFREISKTTFPEQKLQVQSFLKRILDSAVSEEINQRIVNSKNFIELGMVIKTHTLPIESGVDSLGRFRLLLQQAICERTQLEDLSTIELLHDLLEVSPILYLPTDFYSKTPQETVDRLADMLIEKHGLHDTYKILKKTPGLGLMPHSRKIIQYAHIRQPLYIGSASAKLKDDKEFMLQMINEWTPSAQVSINICWAFRHASDRLKDDKDVVLAAVQKHWGSLERATERLRDDKDVVLAAVQNDGFCLEFASDSLKDDKDVVLAALQTDGFSLKFASDRLKNDRGVVLAALEIIIPRIDINKIKDYIPPELKEDPEVKLWLSWNRWDDPPKEIRNSPRYEAMMKRRLNR
jgi:hypothetical protein